MAQRKKEYIIYAVIVILQIAVILFWASQKTNFFIDEFMTMGYTRGFTGVEPTSRYIIDSPEWTFNEWHTNMEFKNQLLMTDKTPLWNLPFFDAIKLLLTGRNYFGLLNIAESVMGFGEVSHWPAVLLNIVLFVIADISLISLMKKLDMSFFSKCMGLSLFGFSSYFLSMAVYVRFYMLVAMFHILMLNLFYKLWKDEKLPKIILHEVGIFAIAFFSLKNTELTGPYLGCISLFIIISFLISKKWKQLVSYCGFCLVGFAYIYFFTNYIQTIFHPEDGGGLVSAIVLGASSEHADYIRIYDEWVMDLLSDQLFGHNRVFTLCAIALTGFTLWKLCRPGDESRADKKLNVSTLSVLLLIGWLMLLGIAEYRNKGILLSKAGLFLTIIWVAYEMFWGKIKFRRIKIGDQTGFALIILSSALLYTCFTSLPNLRIWRYSYFLVTTVIVVIWYIVDRFMKRDSFKSAVRGWQIIFTAFMVFCAVTPFITKSIYYIYSEDKGFIETVKQHSEADVIMYCRPLDGQYAQPLYDCINIMPNDARMYLIDENDYSYDDIDFTEEFIFWDNQREDVSKFLEEIEKRGYEIENLGSNHISQAYLCRISS